MFLSLREEGDYRDCWYYYPSKINSNRNSTFPPSTRIIARRDSVTIHKFSPFSPVDGTIDHVHDLEKLISTRFFLLIRVLDGY